MLVAVRPLARTDPEYEHHIGVLLDFAVDPLADYAVYGIIRNAEIESYLIRSADFRDMVPLPKRMLEVLEPSTPGDWIECADEHIDGVSILGPRELCEDPWFLEKLSDGDALLEQRFRLWRLDFAELSPAEGQDLVQRELNRGKSITDILSSFDSNELSFAVSQGWLRGIGGGAHDLVSKPPQLQREPGSTPTGTETSAGELSLQRRTKWSAWFKRASDIPT